VLTPLGFVGRPKRDTRSKPLELIVETEVMSFFDNMSFFSLFT